MKMILKIVFQAEPVKVQKRSAVDCQRDRPGIEKQSWSIPTYLVT